MQDVFISSGSKLLPNWLEAFVSALACASFIDAAKQLATEKDAVLWIHHELSSDPLERLIQDALKVTPLLKVVVLSNAPSQQEAFQAMSAGASGYCHAYCAPEVLREVRSVVAHGGIWLGRELLQQLIHVSSSLVSTTNMQVEAALLKLTHREREVAIEAAKGLSNKEIARVLNITERTVKAHISACLERLHVKDRLQLALILNDKSARQIN